MEPWAAHSHPYATGLPGLSLGRSRVWRGRPKVCLAGEAHRKRKSGFCMAVGRWRRRPLCSDAHMSPAANSSTRSRRSALQGPAIDHLAHPRPACYVLGARFLGSRRFMDLSWSRGYYVSTAQDAVGDWNCESISQRSLTEHGFMDGGSSIIPRPAMWENLSSSAATRNYYGNGGAYGGVDKK